MLFTVYILQRQHAVILLHGEHEHEHETYPHTHTHTHMQTRIHIILWLYCNIDEYTQNLLFIVIIGWAGANLNSLGALGKLWTSSLLLLFLFVVVSSFLLFFSFLSAHRLSATTARVWKSLLVFTSLFSSLPFFFFFLFHSFNAGITDDQSARNFFVKSFHNQISRTAEFGNVGNFSVAYTRVLSLYEIHAPAECSKCRSKRKSR